MASTQQYKQFGNLVTIPVIETMAEFMLNCFRELGDIPNEWWNAVAGFYYIFYLKFNSKIYIMKYIFKIYNVYAIYIDKYIWKM